MALVFALPLSCWGEAALAGKRDTAVPALSLAPAQERPEPGLALGLSHVLLFPLNAWELPCRSGQEK